ncbi:hypothetical protein KIW84_061129 [Lathyrus oleraceus]|uniref:ATP-dependent DNA helicase n=1 Tax=Pisum sativum TaxID=3888 RepID=A0A9D4W3J1_PEA|nr:hypothetical protein KIW84_061129 [Pisum sativum]
MRSLHDQEFAEFLIRIGGGVEPTKPDDMVRLPLHIAIPWEGEHSIQVLIQHIFPDLELHGWDAPYMVQRAILTPTNDDVQKLNDMIIDQFPGEEHNLLSFDEVEGDNHDLYQQEFLNSIAQGTSPRKIMASKKQKIDEGTSRAPRPYDATRPFYQGEAVVVGVGNEEAGNENEEEDEEDEEGSKGEEKKEDSEE